MKKLNKVQRLQSAIPVNDKLMLESIAKNPKHSLQWHYEQLGFDHSSISNFLFDNKLIFDRLVGTMMSSYGVWFASKLGRQVLEIA